ncbi:MAG: ArsR family transcriptional regulator [Thermoproteota archaeon]|nr:MAG: ArsR family transcriptional regulator [Candidatus Korarchaeota archaeon]
MIEEVFSSRGRIRVLYLLTRAEALNITRLARETKLSVEMAKRHLKKLSELEVVRELKLGRLKFYQLNKDHPLADRIVALFSGVSLYLKE